MEVHMTDNNAKENHIYKVIYNGSLGERHFTVECPESLQELHEELHKDIAEARPLTFIEDGAITTVIPHPGMMISVHTKDSYDGLIDTVKRNQAERMRQQAQAQAHAMRGAPIAVPNLVMPPRQ